MNYAKKTEILTFLNINYPARIAEEGFNYAEIFPITNIRKFLISVNSGLVRCKPSCNGWMVPNIV